MCYHYSFTKKQQVPVQTIGSDWEVPFEPVHHAGGFSFPAMPVVTLEKPHLVQRYQWGLIPHWVHNMADAQKLRAQTLNARADTLFEKPAFRSYTNNRCLVLADGFFEWMEFKKKKYPHYVQLKGGEPFAFAGLYAHWTDRETGELLRTFAIITTDANPLMARIHNVKQRMPVLLQQEQWPQWLHPGLSKEAIKAMLTPCSDATMQAHTISKRISTRGAETNVPEITAPYAYAELEAGEQGSLFDA